MPSFLPVPVTDDRAHTLLAEYFHSRELGFVGGSYTITFPDEAAFLPPKGVFLLVFGDDDESSAEALPVGCGGVRRISDGEAGPRFEVKHLYLRPETRGKGWGKTALNALIDAAAELGAAEVVLDTNSTLTAAGALYRSRGFRDVPAYNDNPNATNWYALTL